MKGKKKVWVYLPEEIERWVRIEAIVEGYNRPAQAIEAWIVEKYNKMKKGEDKNV